MKSIADLPSNILIHILAGPATDHDNLLAHGERDSPLGPVDASRSRLC
jgi:hypothetical protein